MRSVLRAWRPEDGAWYVGELADAEIQRFTTGTAGITAERFRAALAELRRSDDRAGFAVINPETGELAGNIAATRHGGVADVSYWISAHARGRGLAHRALVELCVWIEARWPDVDRVALWAHADNLASQRVAEKAGFRYDRDETRAVEGEQWPVRWYVRVFSFLINCVLSVYCQALW